MQTNDTTSKVIAPLLSPREVAAILGLGRRQVLKVPISQIRLSARTVRYRKEDVGDYIDRVRTARPH